jgi:hypothetical protein
MIFEMAEYSSKNSDDYKREIDKLTSTTNTIDQPTTSEKINSYERDTKESEIQGRKSESIKDKISRIISEFVEETKSEDKEKGSLFGIKSIILGLFVLIGFIILIYSIFVAVVGEPLASTADTIFIAALIGSFTLVGIIVSLLFLKPKKSP